MDTGQVAYPALEEIERRLCSGAIEALTTDIFDTVVWRTVPEPVHAFVLLGKALRDRRALDPSIDPRSFALVRKRSEAAARESLHSEIGATEVRLEEIWQRIPEWCHQPLSRDEAIQLEIDVEREVLVPDLEVVHLLRTANDAGVPVYAVSDTYFSPEQIRNLMTQRFLSDLRFESIFTSSDRRTGKGGDLFDHVLGAIGQPAELVSHLGDNSAADVAPARERGIAVTHMPRRSQALEHLLRRESSYRRVRALAPASDEENTLADVAELDGSLVQLRAKMALHHEANSAPSSLKPMWDYGAEVVGPPLAGFADWVVERAEELGVRRLHCLMREGDFLGELVGHAAAAAGSEVEATNLYLNRQVVMIASIGDASREELDRAFARRKAPTARQLLEMLGVDPSLIPRLSGHLDSRLEESVRREEVLDALEADDAVRLLVQANAQKLRNRIVRLIQREHHNSSGPFVLVDLGWGASIQRQLGQLLRQASVDLRVDGFYLVTHEGAVDTVTHGGRVSGYLTSFGYPRAIASAVIRSPEVLEQVCMPEHGTQLGLTENLDPILAAACLPEAQRIEAATVRDGVRAFQRTYLRYRSALPEKVRSLGRAAAQVAPIVARSCVDPTMEEAVRFGAWQHDAGQGTDHVERLADEDFTDTALHLHPGQVPNLPMEWIYWPSAVARLRDPHLADLSALQAAGLLRPGAGTTEVETGTLRIEASAGVGLDAGSAIEVTPRRNHHGLSYLSASLRGDHIERVQIRLGERPTLMRIDRLVLRLHIGDSAEPMTVRLDEPANASMLDTLNLTRLSSRVLGSTADNGWLGFATDHFAGARSVYRVDVELSFTALGWDPLPGIDPARSLSAERELQALMNSISWRLTRPLRSLRHLLFGGR